MAFYQCFVPVGSLDADTRAAAAEAITTVHAAVIGVPREFVNVVSPSTTRPRFIPRDGPTRCR
jgi:phenylpyruvate tautomerase PptA (4-oxalocrotonate tautomerase family)